MRCRAAGRVGGDRGSSVEGVRAIRRGAAFGRGHAVEWLVPLGLRGKRKVVVERRVSSVIVASPAGAGDGKHCKGNRRKFTNHGISSSLTGAIGLKRGRPCATLPSSGG